MALLSARVALRGIGGESPTNTMFFDLLGVQVGDGFEAHPSDSSWKAALLWLVDVAMDDCLAAKEPSEEFAVQIERGLRQAGEWLSAGREEGLRAWREMGHKADIFVGGWMELDQFDFEFPPEFSFACGRLGLPIRICTND